ncbi:MAG: tetraacyldisaccharide 4'-kinase, partial [Alphaproteobacteria bacterium]
MRKTPAFWYGTTPPPPALKPLGWLYDRLSRLRRRLASPYHAEVPVLCIGNLTMGGSGKTPVAIAVSHILHDLGFLPHFLTRGYGGTLKGPVLVKPAQHSFQDTGDEPLLLARHAPCWVSRKRTAGAVAAAEGGAGAIIMDDGFQNPSLSKNLSFLVIDASAGFGNGAVFPAGPLREHPKNGLKRADACVLLGAEDEKSREDWQHKLREYGY